MAWEADLIARLLADATVAGMVGDNIEWDERVPGGALPAIVIDLISDPRPQNNDGFDGFRGSRIQLNVHARTKAEAIALRDAAIDVLVPAGVVGGTTFLRSFVDNGGSDAEPTDSGRLRREHVDLIIWHN